MNEAIEVFIGCAPNGEDAESLMVLEYSLRKHTNREVNTHHMMIGNSDTWSGWDTTQWATPFSGFRWTIPEHQGFKGKAIYMDSDMIILDDIGKLWDQEIPENKVGLAKGGLDAWRFCVCLWDCERAKKVLTVPIERAKKVPGYHKRMMNAVAHDIGSFEGNWNCIDGEDKAIEDIQILHYSDMSTQPHLQYALPRLTAKGQDHWFDGEIKEHWRKDVIELFDKYYYEALDHGYRPEHFETENIIAFEKESQVDYDKFRNEWSAPAGFNRGLIKS